MNKNKAILFLTIGILMIFCFSIVGYEIYKNYKSEHYCSLCNRSLVANTKFIIKLKNGKIMKACCPQCGLRYYDKNKDKVVEIYATDFVSLKLIDAFKAYYVIGSEYHECCKKSSFIGENKEIYEICYDRCLPSLVAFEKKGEAKRFIEKYGGRIFHYPFSAKR